MLFEQVLQFCYNQGINLSIILMAQVWYVATLTKSLVTIPPSGAMATFFLFFSVFGNIQLWTFVEGRKAFYKYMAFTIYHCFDSSI